VQQIVASFLETSAPEKLILPSQQLFKNRRVFAGQWILRGCVRILHKPRWCDARWIDLDPREQDFCGKKFEPIFPLLR